MKKGQNLKHEKDFFQTGLTEASRRNTRDILLNFMGNQKINQACKNLKRKKRNGRK